MVSPDVSSKIWNGYLETRFLSLDINNIDAIPLTTWEKIRNEYFYERKQSWKLLQEIIRLSTMTTSTGSSPSSNNGMSSFKDFLKSHRIIEMLIRHLDSFNHWYPIRYTKEQASRIPILLSEASFSSSVSASSSIIEEFVYDHKLSWILFTLEDEILSLFDTMVLLTYKHEFFNYSQLELITKLFLSDSFTSHLSSLWINYCPISSSSLLQRISLSIERFNWKLIIVFAESLQFGRMFLSEEDQRLLGIHPLADPKKQLNTGGIGNTNVPVVIVPDPIPIKEIINLCKNDILLFDHSSSVQLLLTNSVHDDNGNPPSSALIPLSSASSSSSLNGHSSIIHRTTRKIIIFLWSKFIINYSANPEDDLETALSDPDFYDENNEENIIENFTILTRVAYAEGSSSPLTTSAASSVASSASSSSSSSLHFIEGTILQEIINIFIRFYICKYSRSKGELLEISSLTTLLHFTYFQQIDLCEFFYDNWEYVMNHYQPSSSSSSSSVVGKSSSEDDEEEKEEKQLTRQDIMTLFPLIDLLLILLQQSSQNPLYLMKILLSLFSPLIASPNTSSMTYSSSSYEVRKRGAFLLSLLNRKTMFLSNEPFEYLKLLTSATTVSSPSEMQDDDAEEEDQMIWLETIIEDSQVKNLQNASVCYAHDQLGLSRGDADEADDINIHGGLWGIGRSKEDEEEYDRPFNSKHWYSAPRKGKEYYRNSKKKKGDSSSIQEEQARQARHHSVYAIRGPFYGSFGRILNIDYSTRSCLIVWNEQFTWLETIVDFLFQNAFILSSSSSSAGTSANFDWDLLLSITELLSFLSSSEFTNLQVSLLLNELWRKISWSLFLKSSSCSALFEEILSDQSCSLIELYSSLSLSSSSLNNENLMEIRNTIASFFGNRRISLENDEINRITKRIVRITNDKRNGNGGRPLLFSTFSNVMLSIFPTYLHSFFPVSSSHHLYQGNAITTYQEGLSVGNERSSQLQRLFMILLYFTKDSQHNIETIFTLLNLLNQEFSEKWLLFFNQCIDSCCSYSTTTSFTMKLQLKSLFYQFLLQILNTLSFVNVQCYQRYQEINNNEGLFSTSVNVLSLVTISNIEILLSSEIENLLSLDSSSFSLCPTEENKRKTTNSSSASYSPLELMKIRKEYLSYYSLLLSLYSQTQITYIQYADLIGKKRLSLSKEKVEFIFESIFILSSLTIDQSHHLSLVLANNDNNRGGGIMKSGIKDNKKIWKDIFGSPSSSSSSSSTAPSTVTSSSTSIETFPLSFDSLLDNYRLVDYLSFFVIIASKGLECLQFIVSHADSVFSSYPSTVSQLYSFLIDFQPKHTIRYFSSFLSSAFFSSAVERETTSNPIAFPTMNLLLVLFGNIRFSLKHYHLEESKRIRLITIQILTRLIAFPEFYYRYTSSQQKRNFIEMIGNSNIHLVNSLLVNQLKASSSAFVVDEQVALWNFLSIFLEYHPNILSLFFSFHSSSTTLSEGVTRNNSGSSSSSSSIGIRASSFGAAVTSGDEKKKASMSEPSSSSSSSSSNLLLLLVDHINVMESYYKDKPLLLYSLLSFIVKLLSKAKLFPLLGKITIYLLSQEKFWENLLKPLLVMNTTGMTVNKPSTLLNDFITSYEINERRTTEIFGSSSTAAYHLRSDSMTNDDDDRRERTGAGRKTSFSLNAILEEKEKVNEVPELLSSSSSSLAGNKAVKEHFNLLSLPSTTATATATATTGREHDKELSDLTSSLSLYSSQMIILSLIFKILSLERYGLLYELNIEAALKITSRINGIFSNPIHKSKFWNWITQFLSIHIHHNILTSTEEKLKMILPSLTMKDFLLSSSGDDDSNRGLDSSFFLSTFLSKRSLSSSSFGKGLNLLESTPLVASFDSLLSQHFHYHTELPSFSSNYSYLKGLGRLSNELLFVNFHYSISMVDLLVLFHWKEFLQLFILPGSLRKQYIAKYKQEKLIAASTTQQQQQQSQQQGGSNSNKGEGESKVSGTGSASPFLGSFSSDGSPFNIPPSPQIGSLSPESTQPDASPLSLRESSFPGDKRSYEIVNEILKRLTNMMTTSHSSSTSSSSSVHGSGSPVATDVGGGGGGGEHSASVTAFAISSSSSAAAVLSSSLFGLISVSENCSLLVNMLHHQLKTISFKDMNPEKSVIHNRDIGSARLTEDKVEKLLHSILMIDSSLFSLSGAVGGGGGREGEDQDEALLLSYWNDEISQASSGRDEGTSKTTNKIRTFLSSSLARGVSSSSSSTSFLEILSCFHDLLSSEGVSYRLPFAYFKYQIKTSLSTSTLLLLNAIQQHMMKSSSFSLTGGSPAALELTHFIDNRLLSLQYSFQFLKSFMKYLGINGLNYQLNSSSSASSSGLVTVTYNQRKMMNEIESIVQILFQILKISIPKSSATSLPSLQLKQLLTFLIREEFVNYLFQLNDYLIPFILPYVMIEHSYSSLLHREEGEGERDERGSRSSGKGRSHHHHHSHGGKVSEKDLKVDYVSDIEYQNLSSVVIDLSSSSSASTSSLPAVENTFHAILSIYDMMIAIVQNGFFLSFKQELSTYLMVINMINSSSLLLGYQKTLISQPQQQSPLSSSSIFLSSLFMGYATSSSSRNKESFVAMIWMKSIQLMELIIQRLSHKKEDQNSQKDISTITQSVIEFLTIYELLLSLPLLTIGSYRYTLSQLRFIRSTYSLIILCNSYCGSLYRSFLPSFFSLCEIKALQYITNLSYYCSHCCGNSGSNEFYLDFSQNTLLSMGIIMNSEENLPILITEEEMEEIRLVGGSGGMRPSTGREEGTEGEEETGRSSAALEEKKATIAGDGKEDESKKGDTSDAHVTFGRNQLFIINNPSASASSSTTTSSSSATNERSVLFSPSSSSSNPRSGLKHVTSSTPLASSSSSTTKQPVSILKSTSKRFGTNEEQSSSSQEQLQQQQTPMNQKPFYSTPLSLRMPSNRGSGLLSSTGRPLAEVNSNLLFSPSDGGIIIGGTGGGGNIGRETYKYPHRLGYYHYSHPYLSFVLLLEKEFMKTFNIVKQFLRQILPSSDGPSTIGIEGGGSSLLVSDEFIQQRYPIGMKVIFFSNHSHSLMEGMIHKYHGNNINSNSDGRNREDRGGAVSGGNAVVRTRTTRDERTPLDSGVEEEKKGKFDLILSSNNLIERNVSLSQIKYFYRPLLSFLSSSHYHQLNKIDFYQFPLIIDEMNQQQQQQQQQGKQQQEVGKGKGSLTMIQELDRIDKYHVLSTSHLYRLLTYFLSFETKDRLVLTSSSSLSSSSVTSPSAAATAAVASSSRIGSQSSSERINHQIANQHIQTSFNSFSSFEYLQLVMELVYLIIASLHHHSYAPPLSQEVLMIQQLIDLQHLLSAFTTNYENSLKQVSSSPSSTVPTSVKPSLEKKESSSASLHEWKDFLSFISTWMEEIYYRLEQSIGIDLTDNVQLMTTPMAKKEGKFR
jgi:hypothetical protein